MVALIIPMVLVASNSYAAVKAGSSCSKAGINSVSAGKTFTCVKSGKKLVWNKGVLVSKPAVVKPEATPVPSPASSGETSTIVQKETPETTVEPNTNVITPATNFIQELIDQTSLTNSQAKSTVVMHVEEGANGIYPNIAQEALQAAIGFYASLGMTLPQPTIHLILGRTQSWMREQAQKYAPGCVDASYRFNGSASLCAYPDRSALYSHLPTAVTMASAAPDNIDLTNPNEVFRFTNQKVLDEYVGMSPHEALHAWQDGNYGFAGKDMPKWVWEGGASIFGEMVVSKLSSKSQSYFRFQPGASGSFGKKDCSGPVETMKPICEYTQGVIVMEYFLFKYGVSGYINLITKSKSQSFSENFLAATGESLADFYTQTNGYLKVKGWHQ